MEIVQGLSALRALPPGLVLSIGNFDGLHRGHQEILHSARRLRNAEGTAGIAVATFEPHPLTALRPEDAPPRLTPLQLKREFLQDQGVDCLVELVPAPAVLELSAEEFWGVIRDEVRPSALVEGASFTFGKGRGGTIERLQAWASESAIALHVIDGVEAVLCDYTLIRVSSSMIRWLVAHGRMRDAARCLGRPYRLAGRVIRGHQRGRQIGVPTANLDCGEQLIPGDGVYAGRAVIEGRRWPVAISIGTMPTFGGGRRQVEVHIIGFSGDLYDVELRVDVVDWVRDQRRFSGPDALKAQLQRDIDSAEAQAMRDFSGAIG